MKEFDIFISHDSHDTAIAGHLKTYLEEIFIQSEIYVSGQNITGGDSWYNSIVKALKESKAIIPLITKSSIDNDWVSFETGAGAVENKSIPLIGDDLRFSDLANYPISSIQARLLNNEGVRKLVEDVANLLEVKRAPINIGDVDGFVENCRLAFLEIEAPKLLPELEAMNFDEYDEDFDESEAEESNKLQNKIESQIEITRIHLKNHWIKLVHKKSNGRPIIQGIHEYSIPKLFEFLQSKGITSQATNYSDFVQAERLSQFPSQIEDKINGIQKLKNIISRIDMSSV